MPTSDQDPVFNEVDDDLDEEAFNHEEDNELTIIELHRQMVRQIIEASANGWPQSTDGRPRVNFTCAQGERALAERARGYLNNVQRTLLHIVVDDSEEVSQIHQEMVRMIREQHHLLVGGERIDFPCHQDGISLALAAYNLLNNVQQNLLRIVLE